MVKKKTKPKKLKKSKKKIVKKARTISAKKETSNKPLNLSTDQKPEIKKIKKRTKHFGKMKSEIF